MPGRLRCTDGRRIGRRCGQPEPVPLGEPAMRILLLGAEPEHGEPAPQLIEQDGDSAKAMLERLKAYGHTPSLQTIYDGLRELGYIPHAPQVRKPGKQPEPYLRWTDPARGGPAVVYFDTLNFWFVRKDDLEILGDLPAGQATVGGRTHNVKFTISAESTGQILQGARRVKR